MRFTLRELMFFHHGRASVQVLRETGLCGSVRYWATANGWDLRVATRTAEEALDVIATGELRCKELGI